MIDETIGEAVRVTVIAAGFDQNAKPTAATVSHPVMTEGPTSDIFTSAVPGDDFFDLGGDDDLPSFLR